MKYTKEQYLESVWLIFQDWDTRIECRTTRMVKTKKIHRCAAGDVIQKPHDIPAGSNCIFEKALVEGSWGSYYMCIDCTDKILDEYGR